MGAASLIPISFISVNYSADACYVRGSCTNTKTRLHIKRRHFIVIVQLGWLPVKTKVEKQKQLTAYFIYSIHRWTFIAHSSVNRLQKVHDWKNNNSIKQQHKQKKSEAKVKVHTKMRINSLTSFLVHKKHLVRGGLKYVLCLRHWARIFIFGWTIPFGHICSCNQSAEKVNCDTALRGIMYMVIVTGRSFNCLRTYGPF